MELATIEMDPTTARKAFLDYRGAIRERHDAEDEAIMRAYRALASGKTLINLPDCIRAGGFTEVEFPTRQWRNGRYVNVTGYRAVPNIAVGKADAKQVWTHGLQADGSVEMRDKRELSDRNKKDRVVVGGISGEWTELAEPNGWDKPRLSAIVPNIPPPLRPATALSNYHLLWEAEWAVEPVPPVDPALIKHVSGDLYAVLAVWDLTEAERAVLSLTRGVR